MSLLPKKMFEPLDEDMQHFLMEVQSRLPDIGKGFVPPVDVFEKNGKVIVETPLAGVDPKDVEVTVEGAVLTIKGKTEHRTVVDEKDYYHKEVRYGAFMRRVPLPAPVLSGKAEAVSEHGLLRITIPKAEDKFKTKPLKIEVKRK